MWHHILPNKSPPLSTDHMSMPCSVRRPPLVIHVGQTVLRVVPDRGMHGTDAERRNVQELIHALSDTSRVRVLDAVVRNWLATKRNGHQSGADAEDLLLRHSVRVRDALTVADEPPRTKAIMV